MSHDPEAAVGLSSRWAKMPVIISSGYIVAEFVSALRCDAIADRKNSIFMVDGIIVVPIIFMSPCRIAFFHDLMHQVSVANLRIASHSRRSCRMTFQNIPSERHSKGAPARS